MAIARKAGVKFTGDAFLKVVGDKELIKATRNIKANILRRVLRPAINFGMTPITKAAKANAPKESGLLKKSIKKKVGKRGAWGKVYVDPKVEGVVNGRKRKPAKYAHLLEFGTEDAPPRPFMRPARDNNRAEVLARVASKAKENLIKVAKKAKLK